MDGSAVKEIAALATDKALTIGELIALPAGWVMVDPAAFVKPGPQPQTLAVATLGAVRDYLQANKDSLPLAGLAVHVSSPNTVQVLGPLSDRARSREAYMTATATDLTAGFLGKFLPLEEFIIGLQVRFADADDRKRILGLLSNVKHETVKTALDDGVTQIVQARAGVAMVSDVAVPNPVLLTPFRTFRDIIQPSSLFVLRVQGGRSGGLPEAGLFEADGGAWRLTAVERVRNWLVEELPAAVAVLA